MRNYKLLLTFFVFSCILLLSGCSIINSLSFGEVTKNMNEQKNLQTIITNDIKMDETSIKFIMDLKQDMLNDEEGKLSYSINTELYGTSTKIEGYMELNKENIKNYLNIENTWYYLDMKPEEYFGTEEELSLNEDDLFNLLDDNLKVVGDSEVDGAKCKIYEFSVDDPDIITSLFLDDSMFDLLDIDKSKMSSYLDDLKFRFYIDFEEKVVRKIRVDLKSLINQMFEGEGVDAHVDRFLMTIEFKNFNNIDITIPEQVKLTAVNLDDVINPTDPTDSDSSPSVPTEPTDPSDSVSNPTQQPTDPIDTNIPVYETYMINLNYTVLDSAIHSSKPIIYFTTTNDNKLYSLNYESNEIQYIQFDLNPESIAFRNNKIYVALLKHEHSSYRFDEEQSGKIAIIDANTFTKEIEFDVDIDPYDIETDKFGYIYVTSGSGQHTTIRSYNSIGLELSKLDYVYEKSLLRYNEISNKLYSVSTQLSPRDLSSFMLSEGKLVGNYESRYHGDYAMNIEYELSPDGKYIFNGAGTIFNMALNYDEDIIFSRSINTEFNDIVFDLDNDLFYTAKNNTIKKYNYSNFERIEAFNINNVVKQLYFNNNRVVAVGDNTVEIIYHENPYSYQNVSEESTLTPISMRRLEFSSDTVQIANAVRAMTMHPEKPILYYSSFTYGNEYKLYQLNLDNGERKIIDFANIIPKNIKISGDQLYVSLRKYPINAGDIEKGAIAIVDLETFTIEKQFPITVEPFDIAIDKEGYVYVSPNTGQETLKVYNQDGNEIKTSVNSYLLRNKLLLEYSSSLNKIYAVETSVNPKNINAFNISKGDVLDAYYSQYHSEYFMNEVIKLSPDGKYIINGGGIVFNCSLERSSDLTPKEELDFEFKDITFNDTNSQFYTIYNKSIYLYNYNNQEFNSFDLIGYGTVPFNIEKVFYQSGKLIAISKDNNNLYTAYLLSELE